MDWSVSQNLNIVRICKSVQIIELSLRDIHLGGVGRNSRKLRFLSPAVQVHGGLSLICVTLYLSVLWTGPKMGGNNSYPQKYSTYSYFQHHCLYNGSKSVEKVRWAHFNAKL